jgi:anti-anti-sigma factor
MEWRWRALGPLTVLELHSVREHVDLDLLAEELKARIEEGMDRLCVNVSGLLFVESLSIGFLVALRRHFDSRGGEVVLSEPSDVLEQTLTTLGLDGVFKVFATDLDAARYLAGWD